MNGSLLRGLSGSAGAVAVLAAAFVIGVFAGHDTAHATTFAPEATVTLADSTPGATSDIITGLNLPAPTSNFGSGVGFLPLEWDPPVDADIPDGAVVGELTSNATLSLGGGSCNSTIAVSFVMVDGTTDTSNIIEPAGPPEDPLQNLGQDADGNGIFDAADKYPDYLNELFPGITPRSRQVGWTDPVNGLTVVLNFLLFEPGTTLPEQEVSPQASLGYPNLTVLQDPTAAPGASIIGDFCTPLTVSITTFGVTRDNQCSPPPGPGDCGEGSQTLDLNRIQAVTGDAGSGEGGSDYRTNPPDGEYSFVGFARSLYDADDDGIENTLDTCPYDANPDFDPRNTQENTPSLDQDQDGIPTICDPDDDDAQAAATTVFDPDRNACPTSGVFDNDNDCFGDRGDNCPLIQNGIDALDEDIGPNNQLDTDSDGIGDACDQNPNTPDGHLHELCNLTTLTIGAGGGRVTKDIPISNTVCVGGAVAEETAIATTTATSTDVAGETTGPSGGGTGAAGGADTGVGSLAPIAGSIPAWAAIASGLGGAGLLGSLAALVGRIRRRR